MYPPLLYKGAISFADMGKRISEAWKNLEDKAPFQYQADKEKERYQRELDAMAASEPPKEDYKGLTKAQRFANAGVVVAMGGHAFTPAFLEARDSSPSHTDRKYYMGHPYDGPHREHTEYNNGTGERGQHNPHHQYHHHHGHYPPQDYYRRHGNNNNWQGAQQPVHYPPHRNNSWEQRPPHGEGQHYENNPHQQLETAQAFSPPRYNNQHHHGYSEPNRSGPHNSNLNNSEGNPEYETQPPVEGSGGYAFQCEVCSTAVFSTFEECAEHEEECAKLHEQAAPIQRGGQMAAVVDGDYYGSKRGRYEQAPSPNKVVKQHAVEGVMMLKRQSSDPAV